MLKILFEYLHRKSKCKCCKDCKSSNLAKPLFVAELISEVLLLIIVFVGVMFTIDSSQDYFYNECPINNFTQNELQFCLGLIDIEKIQSNPSGFFGNLTIGDANDIRIDGLS